MMTDIKPGYRETIIEREMHFTSSTGQQYAFPLDDDGKPDLSYLSPLGVENYNRMIAERARGEIKEYKHTIVHHPVGKCESCGEDVELNPALSMYGIPCHGCGALYNTCGQRLRPREEWEERWEDDY